MELGIHLSCWNLWADGDAFHSVISHDAAPKGVVQIKGKDLFVASVDGLYNRSNGLSHIRDGVHIHGALVHVPIFGVVPLRKAVVLCQIIDIVDVKACVIICIIIETLIQP